MNRSACRWGILGTAKIARKNWRAIANCGNGTLSAVASRTADRAARFIAECQAEVPFARAPDAVGGYERLLERPDVDAVYIPLPTALRTEWVIHAAEAGKHVLCEKPCAPSAAELQSMLTACRRANVQFMDGVMFMHSRRFELLLSQLREAAVVGDVRRIATHFSFRGGDAFFEENIRANAALEPLGCLGDLGWYGVRFALCAMDRALPVRVSGRMLAEHVHPGDRSSVPTEFSGELWFAGGASASFFCSFLAGHAQFASVSGTAAYVHLDDFVIPFTAPETAFDLEKSVLAVRGCDFAMERHPQRFAVPEYGHGHPSAQESRMFHRFGELVRSGQPDQSWSEIALRTQQVVDACLESARSGSVVELYSPA